MLRALLTAIAILLAYAPAGSAAGLVLSDTGLTTTTVRGDGAQRLALTASDGSVSVLDTRTRAFSTIPTPAGCAFADIHRATLLYNCRAQAGYSTGRTYEIVTGRVASLPPLPAASGADEADYATIGDRFARISISAYHVSDASLYVDRATGSQRYQDARFGWIRDLDDPALTRRLCAGQPRPWVQGPIALEPGEPVVAGRWSAAWTLSDDGAEHAAPRIQLHRCGSRVRTIKLCHPVGCSRPELDDQIVAWTETRESVPGTRLVVRRLRSGRVRRTAWQAEALRPVLVDHRLYVLATPDGMLGTPRGSLLRAAL